MDAIQIIDGYIQHKHGTSTEWATENPVLLAWELGLETDTKLGKIGDGATPWNSLPYAFGGAAITITTGNANGTIAVNGTDVAVKGLGSSAYLSGVPPFLNLDSSATKLTSTDDLNNIKTAGTYYWTSAGVPTNTPTSDPAKMTIWYTSSTTYRMQEVVTYKGQHFIRRYDNNSGGSWWADWKQYAYFFYAECSTTASTVAKTVAQPGFVLKKGVEVTVLFTNGSTATTPTLNVNSTGAKAIWYLGTNIGNIDAGMVLKLVYDGTRYRVVGKL